MEFYIGKNGSQIGPLQEDQIRTRLSTGEFSGSDLVWREGMANWEPLERVFGNPYQPSMALGDSPLLKDFAGQRPLASQGARLGAVTLNGVFTLLAMIPLLISMGMMEREASAYGETPVSAGMSTMGMALAGLGVLLLLALVITQTILLSKTGQTLGKKILGIRIVTLDGGTNPGFVQAVLMRTVVPAVISCVPLLGSVFSLVDICFIFREDRRCVHDLMANTKVVLA